MTREPESAAGTVTSRMGSETGGANSGRLLPTDLAAGIRRLLVASWLLAAAPAGAQLAPPAGEIPPSYAFTTWTTDQGLPLNTPNAIVQTRDGYLWLATYGGLARFDGVTFETFDLTNSPGLLSNSIVSLFEDRRGVLWIGHDLGGLSRLSEGRFTAYDRDDGLPQGSVWALAEDQDGSLWIGAEHYLARLRDGKLNVFTTADGLPSQQIYSLLVDRRGDLWVGTTAGLARRIGGSKAAFATVDGLPKDPVYSLAEDGNGTLWVNTATALLVHRDGRFERRLEHPQPMPWGHFMALDRGRRLWVHSGFTGRLHRPTRDGVDPASVTVPGLPLPPGTTVSSLRFDREDNLWIGNANQGLIRARRQPVRRIQHEDGLPGEEVRTISGDGGDGLWVAFDCLAPLTHWHDGVFTPHPADQEGTPLSCVSSLLLDRRGALWVGAGGELVRYRHGVFERRRLIDTKLDELAINVVFEDREDRLWLGLEGYGLARLDRDDPRGTAGALTFYTHRDGLAGDRIHALMQSNDGALWIGTNNGLSRLAHGVFDSWTTEDGLGPGAVRAIHQDADDSLWIGTYGGGLNRLRDGELLRFTLDDGLFENSVSRILEDDHGRLWMLGNRGLTAVHRDDLNAYARGDLNTVPNVSLSTAEGMLEGSGGRQPAGWRSDDGRMWFPTIDGLTVVDAERFRPNDIPPPVVIERLVNGERHLEPRSTVVLPEGNRDLEIHYTGLSFSAPEKMRFRFKMEGSDESWQQVGSRRIAYYTNLPPGTHTFRVAAANNDGLWNEDDATVVLEVPPLWFETWWFRSAAILALGLIAGLGIHRWTRAIRARNRRLQGEIEQRLAAETELEGKNAELEAKNADLERFTYTVSHDLKAPLVSIRGFVGFARQDAAAGQAERLQKDLNRIDAAAEKMTSLLEDLLALSRVGLQFQPEERVALTEVIAEACERIAGQVEERGVELVVAENLPVVRGDPVRLVELFQNLLDNAVKYLGEQPLPRVEVGVRDDTSHPIVFVRDNGLGIDPEFHQQVFGLFERLESETPGTGVGLALVQRIVENHGGRIWVESKGFGQGSTFYLTLSPDP